MLCNVPKATQLASGRARICTWALWLQIHVLDLYIILPFAKTSPKKVQEREKPEKSVEKGEGSRKPTV